MMALVSFDVLFPSSRPAETVLYTTIMLFSIHLLTVKQTDNNITSYWSRPLNGRHKFRGRPDI